MTKLVNILASTMVRDGSLTEAVEGKGMYYLVYCGQHIQIRTGHNKYITVAPNKIKYARTSWINEGHAHAAARRFNKMFNTSDFTVMRVTHGEQIDKS